MVDARYQRTGNLDKAQAHSRGVLSRHPNRADAHVNLGNVTICCRYVTGDWKYTEILPDGTLLGETNGEDAERVEYCIACHLAAEKQDHLYFIPKKYRIDSK